MTKPEERAKFERQLASIEEDAEAFGADVMKSTYLTFREKSHLISQAGAICTSASQAKQRATSYLTAEVAPAPE